MDGILTILSCTADGVYAVDRAQRILFWNAAAERLPAPQTMLTRSTAAAPLLNIPLSAREKEVLYLLVQGKAARAIADTLCISYATVRNHLQTILRKLDVVTVQVVKT
jgi:DNA-binding NarL/FixJ family response regulator